jgi:hypothetical protein
MWNYKRKTVDWVLRGDTAVVFLAMSWALFWASTRWRRPFSFQRPSQRAPTEL